MDFYLIIGLKIVENKNKPIIWGPKSHEIQWEK